MYLNVVIGEKLLLAHAACQRAGSGSARDSKLERALGAEHAG